jgi:hypothetical protein
VGAEDGPGSGHYPFHLSAELTRSWTKRFETGFFLETAPLASTAGTKIAGGHIRPQIRFTKSENFPIQFALSFEYAFSQLEFDAARQALAIRPILERQQGRLHLVFNAAAEFATVGPEAGSGPEFDFAAKVGWDATPGVGANLEYYKTGPVEHFPRSETAHQFLLPTIDLNASPLWELSFGAGHCLVDSHERWVLKLVVGYRFRS